MKRTCGFIVLAMVILFICPLASAQAAGDAVGLGISLGVAFPSGNTASISTTPGEASLNWGFYVNIPLIYTFHISPSSELYKLGSQNATDMDVTFKFIVPLARFSLYAGFAPGLTAVRGVTPFHVGVLGGGSFNLVSNLDAFIQVKYSWIFEGSQNLRVLHVNAGMLFNFR
jgi:hypothetical protein